MKKGLTITAIVALASFTAKAQETVLVIQEDIIRPVQQFNRFAMDIQFGANHAVNPIADAYNVRTLGLFHTGLGARYMLNPKFGLRLSANYDQINASEGSPDFRTDYYRSSLEGVINLGNLLSFDQWTSRFGLLLHAGVGYSVMYSSDYSLGPDHMMNVVGGLTPQWRLNDRWNINMDMTIISNADQDFTYDYSQRFSSRGLSGYLYNYSIGLQYNFGPYQRYADWVPSSDRVNELRRQIEELKENQMDDDNDGVENHLDMEPNTPYGVMVDTKGREIVWYTVYEEMNDPKDMSEGFITYVNAYDVLFDTDKSDLNPRYNRMLDNIANVMKSNPGYMLNLVGHADERGEQNLNIELSQKRADAVKMYLAGKGVPESHIMATGVGEAQPKNPAGEKSEQSRSEDRRVQFIMK